ncbi:MAG: hypothetical protein RLZZ528_478 [Pseudomonadota bacterium]|jgi:RimJ/RimL family protein N-acetyltransferase
MSTSPVVIRTARLLLRPLETGDARWIAEGIADWEVIRWLPSPPWPFGLRDAEAFVAGAVSSGARGILAEGQGIGVIHINGANDLGYWLSRPWHGRGLMTEAARAVVADHFARGGAGLVSGYIHGNAASCNVLTKVGFRETHTETRPSRPLGSDVTLVRMALPAPASPDAYSLKAREK